jgi:hypothetical protein
MTAPTWVASRMLRASGKSAPRTVFGVVIVSAIDVPSKKDELSLKF